MDFINNILAGKIGVREHLQFTRFGRGRYPGRAALNLQKSSRIKLRGSFEYANDFVFLAAELKGKFSGIIMSKEDLGLENKKKKAGIFAYEVSSLEASNIEEIKDKTYCMLLDASGQGFILSMKKKLPKPGKSDDLKIDDKFCQLEADLSHREKIKAHLNLPEAKKVLIKHTFLIDNIILPKGETNLELIRLNAKRKGKIEKIMVIDGQEKTESFNFEA